MNISTNAQDTIPDNIINFARFLIAPTKDVFSLQATIDRRLGDATTTF